MGSEPLQVREAGAGDLAEVVRVAGLVGEDHEWAGGDESYLRHLMTVGRLVVAEGESGLVGYAATRRLDGDSGSVSMLCDLFVVAERRSGGAGGSMLRALWRDEPVRMTFSSKHPAALPLYTRFGLRAWWPLLYLVGDPAAVARPAGFEVVAASPGEAASLERGWTGGDRHADYEAWQARPGGAAFVVRRAGEPVAAGVLGGHELTLEHLRPAPGLDDESAEAVVCAVLAGSGVGAPSRVYLPAPHPAVPALLHAGWRVDDHDLFMSTRADLLDPTRDVPSPGLV